MTIQSRLLVVLFSVLAMAAIGFGIVLSQVVFPGFQHIETEAAEASMARLRNAISGEAGELERLAADWSFWDDTWKFVEDGNQDFVDSNLVAKTFFDTDLALVWILDIGGQTVWRGYLGKNERKPARSAPLPDDLPLDHPLSRAILDERVVSGFIQAGDDILLAVSSPILRSDGDGPVRGMLVFARRFDGDRFGMLSERIHHPVRAYTEITDALHGRPPEVRRLIAVAPEQTTVLDQSDKEHTAGLMRLDSLQGEPLLVLVTRIDRKISEYGADVIVFAMAMLGIAALAALAGGYLLSSRMISAPVGKLMGHIEYVGLTGDLERKVELPATTELGRMAAAFNLMQERLQRVAHFDAVTDLPNRILFRDRARQVLKKAVRDHGKAAIIFIDLDRFKYVNDTFGHEYGDAVLRATAGRLSGMLRSSDTVARLGGDEFAIVAGNIQSASDAERLARNLHMAFEEPIHAAGRDSFIGASIGIALFPDDGSEVEELLKNADIAMYRAKSSGGGCEFYGIAASREIEERQALEHELQQAVRRDEFELFFQPQICLDDDSVCGAEALIRWRHPKDGWRSAASFMPFVEEIGLFRRVDEWVLSKMMALDVDTVHFPEGFYMSMNLSAREFETEDLRQLIDNTLGRRIDRLPAFEIEITENAILKPGPAAEEVFNRFSELGIVLALDDFGTGFSSLSNIKTLPVGTLKIDKSFVRDLPVSSDSRSIVQAILSLGENLGFRIVAEGVETRAELEILRSMGCRYAQGQYWVEPEPPEVFFARFD